MIYFPLKEMAQGIDIVRGTLLPSYVKRIENDYFINEYEYKEVIEILTSRTISSEPKIFRK